MSTRKPDSERELDRVIDGIVESLFAASDSEIEEEARQAGENISESAEETRQLLLDAVRKHRRLTLSKARSEYNEQVKALEERSYDLPPTPEDRMDLLLLAIQSQPSLGNALTVQHRELKDLSDEDVESYLRQLKELGVLEQIKRN